ncbi:MAG TPA: hypothetical protein VF768_06560, partial [Holophagaceae bacterium]
MSADSVLECLVRLLQGLFCFVLAGWLSPVALRAQERPILTLGDLASAEVRQQGFTLAHPMKVHVQVRGAGIRAWWDGGSGSGLFASGWILRADTREVVWQMDGANSRQDGELRVADQVLDLPAGSYEAYMADTGFGETFLFSSWVRNIDRRHLLTRTPPGPGRHSLLGLLGVNEEGVEREWLRQVGRYGMTVSVPASEAPTVTLFTAPLRWRNILFSLAATADGGRWRQAFRLRKAATVHLYAEGEGSGHRLVDTGWIVDARTRTRVWEMSPDKARYAGGAEKNRRQVETLRLPPGDYVATFVTDDSHSPADWNALPPCDPGMYGLTVAVPEDREFASAALIADPGPGPVLAELVRVGNDQDLRAPFTVKGGASVRVYALGERDGDDMADEAWIEDAKGRSVWRMEAARTRYAGGASKNREFDEIVPL